MQCIFNHEIDCPSYIAQKELGYEPNLKEIREKFCPQCPNGPNSNNREVIHHIIPSRGNYIV
ncbi:MAG: hypothetical protein P8Y18_02640 [Candidatus Bathyarchaeota archaeon]